MRTALVLLLPLAFGPVALAQQVDLVVNGESLAGFVLPVIGRFYDEGITARLPEGVSADALKSAAAGSEQAAQWMSIQAGAGLDALGKVAVLPVALAVVFLVLFTLTPRKPAAH